MHFSIPVISTLWRLQRYKTFRFSTAQTSLLFVHRLEANLSFIRLWVEWEKMLIYNPGVHISVSDFWDWNICAITVQCLDSEFITVWCLRLIMHVLKQRSSSQWSSMQCMRNRTDRSQAHKLIVRPQTSETWTSIGVILLHPVLMGKRQMGSSSASDISYLACSHRCVLKSVIVCECSVSSFSYSATIFALSELSLDIFSLEKYLRYYFSFRQSANLALPQTKWKACWLSFETPTLYPPLHNWN